MSSDYTHAYLSTIHTSVLIRDTAQKAPRSRIGGWFRLVATLFFLLSLAGSTIAHECEDCKKKVKIGFTASACSSGNYTVTLNGAVANGVGSCTADQWVSASKVFTELKVDQTYQVVAGTGSCSTHIEFEVPDKYILEIDGIETTTTDKAGGAKGSGDGVWNIVVRGCKDCADKECGESCDLNLGSVDWSVSMGSLADGRSAENIRLQEEALTAAVYTPFALVYSAPGLTNEIDVVRNPDGSLRQIKAPQSLADIVVTIAGQEYEVRFYRLADVGAKVSGVYGVSGQPFVTWRINNPTPTALNKLQISKIQGAVTETNEYAWDSLTNSWSLSRGNGTRIETLTRTTITSTSYSQTAVVKESNGKVVSRITRIFHTFAWGDELLAETVDPDGAALKTTYSYFENAAQAGKFRKLKSISYPDGSWVQYDYDAIGNTTLEMRPWKDSQMVTATEANSRVILSTYSNTDGVKVSLYPKQLSSIEEKILGITVARITYTRTGVTVDGQPATREVETSYASVGTQQTTIRVSYHSSATPFLANRISSVQHPDDRKDTYAYEKGIYTSNPDPSLNQFTPDANGTAQRMTVTHGTVASPVGIAFRTTKETSIQDQSGNTVFKENYVYDSASYERIGWSALDYDTRGFLTQIRRNTGQMTTLTWNGDKRVSEIDEAGIETTYTYDDLGRIKTQTKKGISSGSFPVQADIVTTYTYDAEGHTIGETVSGGSFTLSKSTAYDLAGRTQSELSQAGLSTTYSYANGGRTQTIVMPGGAAQIKDRYLDGQNKSETGTAVVARYYDYGINPDATRFTQLFEGSAGLSSPRWTKTHLDWLNRTVKIERPGFMGENLVQTFSYNNKGQLQTEGLSAGATRLQGDKLHEYDSLGNETRVGLDLDSNGSLVPLSIDRIIETDRLFQKDGNDWFSYETAGTYLTNNDVTLTRTQSRKERLSNFPSNGAEKTVSELIVGDELGGETITTVSVDRVAKKTTTRINSPDSNVDGLSVSVNGLLQSTSPTLPITATSYTYDSLGRPIGSNDPRTGASTKSYNASTGQLTSVGDGVQTIIYEYYAPTGSNAGKLKSQADNGGKKSYFNYNSRGQMIQTWGDKTYPAEYVYDSYGQKTEMHTFRGGSGWQLSAWPASTTGAADITRWIYDPSNGLLAQKQDAVNKQDSYTYDAARRLKTHTLARLDELNNAIVATYSYHSDTGELIGIDYSDATADITFGYDRGGRQTAVTDAAGTHARTFTVRGDLQGDQITGGILDGVNTGFAYDAFQRRDFLQASCFANILISQNYSYDAASRLETITSSGQTATYTYYPNTGFLNGTAFTGGTNLARSYDAFGRLQAISTTPAADAIVSYAYTYNNLSQRTKLTREDNTYSSFIYNDRGELVSAKKSWPDNAAVLGNQSEYLFDNIGNRSLSKAGGNGISLRQSTYTTNSLNQYVQRTLPGAVDIMGTANSSATVSVNNQATARRGDFFYKELSVDNSAGPAYPQINIVGARNSFGAGGEDAVTEKGGRVYLAQSNESYAHDSDGNLTVDGRWQYTWDAENRLTAMETIAAAPLEARRRLEFAYDFMGRRIQKKVFQWNIGTGSYQLQTATRFVYDGWNLVAELNAANALVRNYVWGQDVSDTLQNAGGIGGLLILREGANSYFAGYDGNGNLAALVNADGKIAALYEYGAFGEMLKEAGVYASSNPFRFSTKYRDQESDLHYFGFRYYSSQTGSWLSRDPIEEAGGLNIYGFVENNPLSQSDLLGQLPFSDHAEKKLWDLFQNHGHEVGSQFGGDRRGRQPTDCITYVRNVIEYAYEKINRKDIARRIHAMPKDGMPLASYLVTLGWRAHYWNPDSRRPNDNSSYRSEHPVSYQNAIREHTYYGVAVSGFVVDYNPTYVPPRQQTWREWWYKIQPPSQMTPKRMDAFNRLSGVKFAYGLARGGYHTFLLSYGMVFEVHWAAEGDDLYERSPLYDFAWKSGLILTPPDSSFTSDGN